MLVTLRRARPVAWFAICPGLAVAVLNMVGGPPSGLLNPHKARLASSHAATVLNMVSMSPTVLLSMHKAGAPGAAHRPRALASAAAARQPPLVTSSVCG